MRDFLFKSASFPKKSDRYHNVHPMRLPFFRAKSGDVNIDNSASTPKIGAIAKSKQTRSTKRPHLYGRKSLFMKNSSESQTADDELYSLLLQIAGQRKRKHHGLQKDTRSLAHDLWIKFVERRSEIKKPQEWLSKTLKHMIIDCYRSRNRSSTLAENDIESILDNKMLSQLIEKERFLDRLNRIFEAMDKAKKDTTRFSILSLYILGYSKIEIEQALGEPRRAIDRACIWIQNEVRD